jgi:hypothetical protein
MAVTVGVGLAVGGAVRGAAVTGRADSGDVGRGSASTKTSVGLGAGVAIRAIVCRDERQVGRGSARAAKAAIARILFTAQTCLCRFIRSGPSRR